MLTNAFGSERRICMAMGVDSLDDRARLREILNQSPPTTFAEKVRMAGKHSAGHVTCPQRAPVTRSLPGGGAHWRDGRSHETARSDLLAG